MDTKIISTTGRRFEIKLNRPDKKNNGNIPRILETFDYEHLGAGELKEISKRYHDEAWIFYWENKEEFWGEDGLIISEAIRTLVSIREAKDNAVRVQALKMKRDRNGVSVQNNHPAAK